MRRGRRINFGYMIFFTTVTIMGLFFGEGTKLGLVIWGILANIMIGIMIKFKDYNFIAEVAIKDDDICFMLVRKVLIVKKQEIKEMVYTYRYVYIYLTNGERLYAHRKDCIPKVIVNGEVHQGILPEDFIGVKFRNKEEDTSVRW